MPVITSALPPIVCRIAAGLSSNRWFQKRQCSPVGVETGMDAEREGVVRSDVAEGKPEHGRLAVGDKKVGPDLAQGQGPRFVHGGRLADDEARRAPQSAGLGELFQHPLDAVRRFPNIFQQQQFSRRVYLIRCAQCGRDKRQAAACEDAFHDARNESIRGASRHKANRRRVLQQAELPVENVRRELAQLKHQRPMEGDGANALGQGDQQRSRIGIADHHFGRQGGEGIPIEERPQAQGGGTAARAPNNINSGIGVGGGKVGGPVGRRTGMVAVAVPNMRSDGDMEAAPF